MVSPANTEFTPAKAGGRVRAATACLVVALAKTGNGAVFTKGVYLLPASFEHLNFGNLDLFRILVRS